MKARLFKIKNIRSKRRSLFILFGLLSVMACISYLLFDSFGSGAPAENPELSEKTNLDRTIDDPRVVLLTQLSGPFEKEGKMLRLGVEMAWKELDQRGAPGELTVLDAGHETPMITESVRALTRDPDVVAIVAHLPVKTVMQIAPILEKRKVLMIVPASSHQQLTQHPWVLPLVCLDSEEGAYAAIVAKTWAKDKPAAVVHSTSTYGELLYEGFMSKAQDINLDVAEFTSNTDGLSVQDAVEKVFQSDPAVIWMAGSPFWGVNIISALAEKGYEGKLLVPRSYGEMLIEDLLGEYLNQLYVLRPALVTDKNNTALQEFTNRFRELYWREPKWLAVLGYDAMKWIGEVLRKGPISRTTFRDYFLQYDSPMNAYQGLAGPVYFDSNGHTQRPLQVTVYRNGRFMPYDEKKSRNGSS